MLKLKPRKTVDDYMKLPEGTLAELIEGELLMTPSPKSHHQIAVRNLIVKLDAFVREHGLGQVLPAPMDVHLPSGDVVEPDVIFIAERNTGIIQDWIRGVPDFIIEIVSSEGIERDRIVKRDLYARNGVPEYWIADPGTRTIEVFVLESGRYAPRGYFEFGDSLVSPSLPGFSLPLESVFGKP